MIYRCIRCINEIILTLCMVTIFPTTQYAQRQQRIATYLWVVAWRFLIVLRRIGAEEDERRTILGRQQIYRRHYSPGRFSIIFLRIGTTPPYESVPRVPMLTKWRGPLQFYKIKTGHSSPGKFEHGLFVGISFITGRIFFARLETRRRRWRILYRCNNIMRFIRFTRMVFPLRRISEWG